MDKQRWRFADTNPVVAAVDSATVIEIGDLLWQDVHDAKPASALAHSVNFAKSFLGVAMQRSRKGAAQNVRVATSGVFEFDCPSGTFELGDLVGAAMELISDGTDSGEKDEYWVNQHVEKVSFSQFAIGRVAKREPSAVASVLVDIRSRVMTNGVL